MTRAPSLDIQEHELVRPSVSTTIATHELQRDWYVLNSIVIESGSMSSPYVCKCNMSAYAHADTRNMRKDLTSAHTLPGQAKKFITMLVTVFENL